MKICLPRTLVSLQQRQTGKLSEPCETESASVRNPVGSEKIYILYIVDKFIHVHSVVAFLNKKCKKYSMPFIISKQGIRKNLLLNYLRLIISTFRGCVILFISECNWVRERGTVNRPPKHKGCRLKHAYLDILTLGEARVRIFYRRILPAYNQHLSFLRHC